jgi:protein-disulfide isomerase
MANNNPRTPNRPGQRSAQTPNRKIFYTVLAAIVLAGAGTIIYLKQNQDSVAPQSNPTLDAMRQNYANAGPPQPYVLGDSTAKVTIEEFADFECPSCGRFATITEPDVRKTFVLSGKVLYKYYDFPLPMHKNTQAASMAAACANEQGKFWEMHDALFGGQDQWGLSADETGTEVTDDPKPIFAGYARTIGLNTTQWEQCFDSKKYQGRVDANAAEALRRNVESTPTFYVNGHKAEGAMSFDEMKKLVDAAAQDDAPSAADSAMNNIIKH